MEMGLWDGDTATDTRRARDGVNHGMEVTLWWRRWWDGDGVQDGDVAVARRRPWTPGEDSGLQKPLPQLPPGICAPALSPPGAPHGTPDTGTPRASDV